MTYPAQLRRKVLAQIEEGMGKREAARLFKISPNTVYEWLEKNLIRLLDRPSIVVMDNAPFHKKKQSAAILRKKGHARLPLPPYSPDFNPIENSFGALKRKRELAPPTRLSWTLLNRPILIRNDFRMSVKNRVLRRLMNGSPPAFRRLRRRLHLRG